MPDIASLGFKADVSELERANVTLDNLATNAAKAEKASKSMGDAIGKAGKSGGGGGGIKQTAADVEKLLDKLNPTSKAFDELDKSMRQLSSARGQGLINVEQFRDYTAIIERQRTAIQGTYDELTGYAQKQRETAAAEKQATQARQTDILSLNRLRAALDPAGEAARRMQEQFSLLAKARAGGLIDTKTYSDLTAKLNGLSKAAKEGGASAGQLREGWSGATQQFIDFGVELNTGTNPLTALIRQGPQLAYSFGSVGNTLQAFRQQFSEVAKNFGFGAETIEDQAADVSDSVGDISESMNNTVDAAKNVGAGFARFINPTTVVITALVAGVAYLGYQAYKSSVQMDTFQKAINSTGNIAGVSARKLSDLADQVDKNTNSGRNAAAEAVALSASIGMSADEIQKLSEAALNLSESTGESVKDILANFKRLAKDPVDALISLNQQYNFANTALYEQVKALSDAGDKTGAMQLVVSQLDASTKRLGETTETSINNSSGFWDNLAFSISNAWQNLKNYNAEQAGGNYKGIGGGGGYDKGYDPYGVQAQAKATALSNKQVKDGVDGLLASLDKEAVKIKQFNRESIAANDEIDRLTKSQRTNAQIRNEETARYNKLRKEGLISEEKANAAIAAINEKYKDPKGPKPKKEPAVKVDQGDKLTEQYQAQNLALDAQIRLLQNRNTNQANASTQRKDYLELEAKYAILQEAAQTRALTKQEQQMLASKDQVLAEAAITAQKGDQLASMQRQVQVSDELAKMTMDVQEQARIQSEYAGMSTREMEKQVELAKVRSAVLAKGGTGAQADQAESTKRAQQDLEEASRGDWIGASQTALADWADSATNYAAIARDSITKAMDTAASSVSDFLTTGKADFASFAKSILKMIADVISQLLVMQAIKAGASALGFGGLTANAKGGVYQDPSLHSYVNGVYSSPQMFQFGGRSQFANGGVFAEAGPEAIMPLTRDGKGRLGVRSEGGGSGGIMITNHITVDAGGNTQASSTTSGDAMANALAKQMNDAAEGVLQKAVRPGGIVYNFTKGR